MTKEKSNRKIVVIGGTGLIGSKVVSKLSERGYEVIAASPNSGVNTLSGEGLAEALEGASVVVDVSNSPSFEDAPVMEFFKTSTGNLIRQVLHERPINKGGVMTSCPNPTKHDSQTEGGLQ